MPYAQFNTYFTLEDYYRQGGHYNHELFTGQKLECYVTFLATK